MKAVIILTIAMLVMLLGCVDPFELDTKQEKRYVTVNGLLTTQPELNSVRLTLSNKFDNTVLGNTITLTDCKVSVRDEFGNVVFFPEKIVRKVTYYDSFFNVWVDLDVYRPTGVYEAPQGFKATLGIKYTLNIETPDGRRITSLPEYATPIVPVEDVKVRHYTFPSSNPLIKNTGIYFDVTFKDNPETKDYYFWKPVNGIGVLKTFPNLYSPGRRTPDCLSCIRPKPCCYECFMPETRLDGTFEVADDFLFDGLQTTLTTVFIEDDGFRFARRYRTQINQYSTNERGYQYLKLLKQQLAIEGSVFDPPPANFRSNMINLTDENEPVLGYFFVSDVTSKVVYVDRDNIPTEYQKFVVYPDDCREFFSFTGIYFDTGKLNTIPPDDWEWE